MKRTKNMRRMRLFGWELRLAKSDYWDQCVDMEVDFSHYLTEEVKALIEAHGCAHGHDLANTPPMFYPEALACALGHARAQAELPLKKEIEELRAKTDYGLGGL